MLIEIFWNVLTPIFLVAGVGFWGRRRLALDGHTFSAAVFYILTPCLVFTSLYHLQVEWRDVVRVMGFYLSMAVALASLGFVIALALRWERAMASAFVMTLVLLNNGNYGIPLNRFAFGEVGAQFAVLYYALSAILGNTAGILIARSGSTSLMTALKGLRRVPLIYATALAILLRLSGMPPPSPLLRAAGLLGEAAVPVMLMILGMQLASIEVSSDMRPTWMAAVIRLVLSPLLATVMTSAWGLQGMARMVGITQWGVPTAVLSAVLATQYDCKPRYVATVVLITTLLSAITMSVLLSLIGTGALTHM
ncbi:MAG: AEC family transporter [Anaerolineae bacterium]|nr:AEC family transporter [Anaerolineae bacterium]MDW8098891.1 AEC family transporter [Anaerolineae bacterium]